MSSDQQPLFLSVDTPQAATPQLEENEYHPPPPPPPAVMTGSTAGQRWRQWLHHHLQTTRHGHPLPLAEVVRWGFTSSCQPATPTAPHSYGPVPPPHAPHIPHTTKHPAQVSKPTHHRAALKGKGMRTNMIQGCLLWHALLAGPFLATLLG